MIALHDCTRYLVWLRHHGQQKSAIVLPQVEYCALPNSSRYSVVTATIRLERFMMDPGCITFFGGSAQRRERRPFESHQFFRPAVTYLQ